MLSTLCWLKTVEIKTGIAAATCSQKRGPEDVPRASADGHIASLQASPRATAAAASATPLTAIAVTATPPADEIHEI
jgi:hypothetical protein